MIVINILEAVFSAFVYAVAAMLFLRTTPETLPQREKLCRNRIVGVCLATPATLLCVPLAIPVCPGFLLPLLWPLAVILPVLCYFYIDFYAARSLALWMIVSAYGMIHTAFDHGLAGLQIITIAAWIAGIAGIWISAKPYLLRNYFRSAAEKRFFRWGCVIFATIMMLVSLAVGIQVMLSGE